MKLPVLSVLCVLLCSGCGPMPAWAQVTRGSLSQRISQWMVGRMGLGGMPAAAIPGLGMPSITGMSGLGGFFGMSPIGSGLLSVMGLGTRSQPTYVPPPAPAAPPPPPPQSAPPPPPPSPPPPPPSTEHGPPPSSNTPHSYGHSRPSHHHSASHETYSRPPQRPPPSSYRAPPAPYNGPASPHSHGLPPPIYSGLHSHSSRHRPHGSPYIGPSPNGGFYRSRGGRGSSYLFAEDASFSRPKVSSAIPIVVPRHSVRGPIRGPVAVKTPYGLMLGPFQRPVHQHGMPTIGDTPVIMDDVSMAGGLSGHDLIDSSAMSGFSGLSTMDHLSMRDLMTSEYAGDDAMATFGLDDTLPLTMDGGDMDMFDKSGLTLGGSLAGDTLIGDTMKVSDLGGEMARQSMLDDDMKSLDMKDNLLAAASERHEHHHTPPHGHRAGMRINQQQQRHLSNMKGKPRLGGRSTRMQKSSSSTAARVEMVDKK